MILIVDFFLQGLPVADKFGVMFLNPRLVGGLFLNLQMFFKSGL
jgi:hypothetical protein